MTASQVFGLLAVAAGALVVSLAVVVLAARQQFSDLHEGARMADQERQ